MFDADLTAIINHLQNCPRTKVAITSRVLMGYDMTTRGERLIFTQIIIIVRDETVKSNVLSFLNQTGLCFNVSETPFGFLITIFNLPSPELKHIVLFLGMRLQESGFTCYSESHHGIEDTYFFI